MGTGISLFLHWEDGILVAGTGIYVRKKNPKWEWDWCFVSISVGSGHWLVGFGKKWWLGNGIGNPPSRPSYQV